MKTIKKITEEINKKVPDLSEKIADSVDWNAVKESCDDVKKRNAAIKTAERNAKRKNNGKSTILDWLARNKKVIITFAACLIIVAVMIPIGMRIFYKEGDSPIAYAEEYDLVIDVNPSIMLTIDKTDKVSAQAGLNEDGVLFLYNKKYVGMTADEATLAVTEELKSLGLIKDGCTVRISAVKHNTKTIYEEKQSHAEIVINSVLNANVTTVFLSDDELDKLEDYYKNHDVLGKELELVNGLKNKVKELIVIKSAEIKALSAVLGKYVGDYDDDVVIDVSETDRILLSDYCNKYGITPKFDINGEITYEELEEFIEELEESEEDLLDALEDVDDTAADSFGETLKDLIEMVKEDIFNREDD